MSQTNGQRRLTQGPDWEIVPDPEAFPARQRCWWLGISRPGDVVARPELTWGVLDDPAIGRPFLARIVGFPDRGYVVRKEDWATMGDEAKARVLSGFRVFEPDAFNR